MIRFHLDHNIDLALASALRKRHLDVTVADEIGMCEASDEEHLRFAFAEQRILVTHDSDYLRLGATGVDHYGIVYVRLKRQQIGRVARTLEEYAINFAVEDFRQQVIYLQ